MQEKSSPIRAAIDIGSNTTHIVVAHCQSDTLDIIADEDEMIRIDEDVTATGEISSQKQKALIKTVQSYQKLAKQHDAEQILAVATEALRKAHNGNEFLEQLQQQTGLQVQIISGDAEAVLTFFGATYELHNEPDFPPQIGVMDVGGGSTEVITAKNTQITWRTSIHIGSSKLHDQYLPSDPPKPEELQGAQKFVNSSFEDLHIPQRPPLLIVTGSSALSLLQLAQHAFEHDPQSSSLTQDDLLRCEGLLNALPSKEIAQRYQQHPERARILLAGALIIHEGMKRLGLDEIRVSPHGLREGVLLARERYGDNWLDQINTIASQTESGKSSDNQQASSPEQGKSSDNQNHQDAAQAHPPDKSGEPFAQFGRDTLPKQTKKFLKWPKDILKHQDTEPVHKMRVASRHVRATLDAYESLVKPKRFKSVNRRVKKLADRLGTVRDTDVMIQGLQEQLKQVPSEEQPGIQWLIDRLHTYHQQQQKVLDTSLQKLKKKALKQQIQSSIPKGI